MLNTSNDQRKLLPNFDQLFATTAQAPGGVARLRELILTLAVQGRLVAQDASDEPASELLKKIRVEKDRLIAEGKIKKDKPLAEIREEEKPFELPVGWEWARFGDISINRDGERIPVSSSDREKRGKIYDYYGASGVIDKIDNFLFDKTLLLIGEDGANLISRSTPIAFLAHGKYWVNNHAHVLDATQSELLNYFCLYINAISLEPYVTGTAQPKMNQAKLNSIVVPLPPLAEQSRIVARVEELMHLCDALEEKGRLEHTQHQQLLQALLDSLTQTQSAQELARHWQRLAQHFDLLIDRPEAVDELEQTILQLAVRGLLVEQDASDEPASELLKKNRAEKDRLIAEGKIKKDKPLPVIGDEEKPFELPSGWDWTRVGCVIEMLNGYAFKSEWFKPEGVRLLRNLNISHGKVDWSQPAMLDEGNAKNYEAFSLKEGDLVLSLDRPIISTGLKYAVIRKSDLPCLLLQRVARLSSYIGVVHSEYLSLWLQSDLFVGTIDPGRSNGIPHISTKQVSDLAFGLPPLAEQSRIVARVTELRTLCQQLRDKLTQARSTQTQLAQAWVEQAVT
ncbi:restriction endonuclease subunit S [Comamonas sp. C11]|uniref:restriction endonuclease subunit S n=1 Tax=Comamonas sp. C11 TaxID=2966554 RepID=UPI002111F09A|nr:restriction endonuclease subunit S [Comamonas sp. C11]UUC91842.1 restriction endonuclease subunit S [Comamonas sp. C11]